MRDEAVTRFAVLGGVAVIRDGNPLDIGPPKQRLLLGMLLCRAGSVVSVERLSEALWSNDPPRTARKNLQVYVANLRKTLSRDIEYVPPGYLLRVDRHELDLARFESFATAGRRLLRQGDRNGAAALLDSAVRCWRGPALADFAGVPAADREADRLATRFLSVYEDWAEVQSDLDGHAQILDSIDDVASRHPFRERLSVARMTALARCGRTPEALAHYDDVRQRLAAEFGISPSPVLTRLYRRILAGGSTVPVAGPAGRPAPGGLALPPDLPDFVGRRELLARLAAALTGTADVVVLTGPPGTGKTVTAVRAAGQLATRFPDGALLVPLRTPSGHPRDAGDVLAALLREAGLSAPDPADRAGLVALWRAWVADRQLLLILDDAPDGECVRLVRTGPERSRILVTSRRRLTAVGPAHHVELTEFPPDEALDLLGAIAGAGRLLREYRAAARLVDHAGRFPLAVRALGERLAAQPHVPLGEYADRLAADLFLLEELGAGDRSLRSRFDDWLEMVPAHLRPALDRLAGSPGPAGDLGPTDQAQLAELNLVSGQDIEVTAHTGGLVLPDLVRRYLHARLATTRGR